MKNFNCPFVYNNYIPLDVQNFLKAYPISNAKNIENDNQDDDSKRALYTVYEYCVQKQKEISKCISKSFDDKIYKVKYETYEDVIKFIAELMR